MEEKILKFDSYYGALDCVAEILKHRKVDLNVKHIVLTPEKDTLKCEQLLFCGGGAFDTEVYSLTRWFYKLGGGRLLSRTGAVMILKDILRGMDLKCFYRSKGFSGFCSRLYDTLCRFWDGQADIFKDAGGEYNGENITGSDERKTGGGDNASGNGHLFSGALGLKLQDLKCIAEEFEKRTKDYYIGRAGTTRLIAERLKSGNPLKNTHVYAVNFDRLSASEEQLFSLIAQKAESFTRFITSGRREISAKTEVYRATDIINCLKAAALRIREKSREGESFNDMAVVAPDLSFEQAKRIMDENGIPFYVDKTERLKQTRLAEYLESLISLKRLSRHEFIILAKNPFSGIDRDDADIFENYVNAFLIDYLGFAAPFSRTNPLRQRENEEIRLKTAEKVRKALYKTVTEFWDSVSAAKSTAEFCRAVGSALSKVCEDTPERQKIEGLLGEIKEHLPFKREQFDKETALNEDRMAEGTVGIQSKNAEDDGLLGNSLKQTERLIDALKEGIAALDLSRLPKTQGCVLIGDAGIFKGSLIKHVFAVGFNDGVMPALSAVDSLLTEEETRAVNACGATLPLREELNSQREYELLQLFSGAKTLFIGYIQDGESRPSPLLYTLKAEAKDITYSDPESEKKRAEAGDKAAALRLAGSKSAALEQLIINFNRFSEDSSGDSKHCASSGENGSGEKGENGSGEKGEEKRAADVKNFDKTQLTPFTYSLALALGKSAQKYLRLPVPTQKIRQGLFFKNKTVSVSQLQSYFLCPYKHFVDYGLRAKERERGEMSVLDVGAAAHRVSELYVLSGLNQDLLESITDEVLNSGIFEYKLIGRQKDRLRKEIITLCGQFGDNIRRGQFKPMGAEIRFGTISEGSTGKLKGIEIEGVTLKGSIDYVDTMEGYARIIDYKTGNAALSDREIYYGRKLQLPLYLRVLAENGFKPVAMLYFVFKESRGGDNRFCGLYLSDINILQGFDSLMQEENAVVNAKVRTLKSGESKISGTGCVTDRQLWQYLDYAAAAAGKAVRQISEGNIAPSPLKDGSFCTCGFCCYLPACGGGLTREAGRAQIKTKDEKSEEKALCGGENTKDTALTEGESGCGADKEGRA